MLLDIVQRFKNIITLLIPGVPILYQLAVFADSSFWITGQFSNECRYAPWMTARRTDGIHTLHIPSIRTS